MLLLERREQRREPLELVVGEAGPDAPDVAQAPAVLVVSDPDEQRADPVAAAAFAGQPAADDELLALDVLDLDPAGERRPGS